MSHIAEQVLSTVEVTLPIAALASRGVAPVTTTDIVISSVMFAGVFVFVGYMVYHTIDTEKASRREPYFERDNIKTCLQNASDGDLLLFEKVLREEKKRRSIADD